MLNNSQNIGFPLSGSFRWFPVGTDFNFKNSGSDQLLVSELLPYHEQLDRYGTFMPIDACYASLFASQVVIREFIHKGLGPFGEFEFLLYNIEQPAVVLDSTGVVDYDSLTSLSLGRFSLQRYIGRSPGLVFSVRIGAGGTYYLQLRRRDDAASPWRDYYSEPFEIRDASGLLEALLIQWREPQYAPLNISTGTNSDALAFNWQYLFMDSYNQVDAPVASEVESFTDARGNDVPVDIVPQLGESYIFYRIPEWMYGKLLAILASKELRVNGRQMIYVSHTSVPHGENTHDVTIELRRIDNDGLVGDTVTYRGGEVLRINDQDNLNINNIDKLKID